MKIFGRCPEKVYSVDNEVYGDYEEILEKLGEFSEDGKYPIVHEGFTDIVRHSYFIDSNIIIEGMINEAYDNYGEYMEEYLENVTTKQIQELQYILVQWFNKNIEQPEFSRVFNTKVSSEEF